MEITLESSLIGHHHPIYCSNESINPEVFFTGGVDAGLVEWSSKNNSFLKVIIPVDASIYSILNIFNPNLLLCGLQNGNIHFLNFTEDTSGKLENRMDGPVYDIQYSVSKNKFYSVSGNGSIYSWDANTLKVLQKIKICDKGIRCLIILEKENKIILGCKDTSIRILDLDSLEEIHQIREHTLPVFSIAQKDELPYFISGSRDAQIKIWDKKSYQLIENIPAHLFAVNKLIFHPEENLFVSASMDKSIKFWNADNFKLMKIVDRTQFDSHRLSINSICFSEKSKLISVSDDKLVKIWNLKF